MLRVIATRPAAQARSNPRLVRASPRKRMTPTLARAFRAGGIHRAMVPMSLALACFTPIAARAQQVPGLTVRWQAPARCPQQAEVSERVRKLSGSRSSVQGALQADGTITQADDGRFHLKLLLRAGGLVGERNIDSSSCADLSRAAAVAIALLLHSDEPLNAGMLGDEHSLPGARETSEAAGGSTVPAADRPQSENENQSRVDLPKQTQRSEPPGERAQTETLPSGRREHVRLRAPLAASSVGPLPRPEWGVSLAVGASSANWQFWLEGSEWKKQQVPAGDFPGYSASVRRASASLRGCRASRFSAFELAPCLVVSVEHVSAAGAGENVAPQSQQVNWLSAGVGVQGRVYLGSWFSLTLSVDGVIEASRPRIFIGGVGLVDQIAPAAFTAMVGPEWIL